MSSVFPCNPATALLAAGLLAQPALVFAIFPRSPSSVPARAQVFSHIKVKGGHGNQKRESFHFCQPWIIRLSTSPFSFLQLSFPNIELWTYDDLLLLSQVQGHFLAFCSPQPLPEAYSRPLCWLSLPTRTLALTPACNEGHCLLLAPTHDHILCWSAFMSVSACKQRSDPPATLYATPQAFLPSSYIHFHPLCNRS